MSSEAIGALELAASYVEETRPHLEDAAGNPELAREILHNLDLALKQIRKARDIDPAAELNGVTADMLESDAHLFRGAIFQDTGERGKAVSSYEKSIAVYEENALAHHQLGLAYAQTGRKDDALRHLKRAVELRPDEIDFRKSLDRVENVSGAGLKAGAFHGSWKVLLIWIGITAVSLFVTFSSGGDAGSIGVGLMMTALFAGITFLYWRRKSRV